MGFQFRSGLAGLFALTVQAALQPDRWGLDFTGMDFFRSGREPARSRLNSNHQEASLIRSAATVSKWRSWSPAKRSTR